MATLLRVEAAAFYYPQNDCGLPPVSLQVEAGQGLLITGPSGYGKSTLARCATGLIPHLYHGRLEGSIWLSGLCTVSTPLWQLTEHAGLVFQNPAVQMLAPSVEEEILFGLENLGLSRPEMAQRLEEGLECFNLGPFRGRNPHTLSGGEQQKLALAAILARRPEVLVLDEPLSMLDSTSALEFVERLTGILQAGRALLICEHRQEYLEQIAGLGRLHLGGEAAPPPPALPPLESLPTRPPFHLEIRDLHVTRGRKPVLQGLNLSLASGQVVALVGRNGVGKTTLLRTLAGFQPFQGTVRVQSGSVGEKPGFGLVFQNPDLQLFNASVREEILYRLPNPNLELYTWLLQALKLNAYEAIPPLLLSEGEKRRVALATLVMRRAPHGILLDEPSLGQDVDHKRILVRLIQALAAAGQLVMMATHDLELAAKADQLVLLGPDGIITAGEPCRVLADAAAWQQVGLVLPPWMEPVQC